ncbi:hypothetical protein PVAP13_4KG031716 [Panicum virgatum]|uniref:DUF4283 domain-containing protein n=1 Tax=Panicum virgatum TaxID=38727 RepID=A0A8T0TI78_PANVG|nr:hypothetical protein PVAP13_4KG031716 [Panicum virgatum]
MISVVGGVLTKEQVVSQLQRIFPGKWTWDLMEHEENVFITKFPSKHELQRAIAFGGADVKVAGLQGLRLQFDVWAEKEEGFLLPKVWVRVYGIRKFLREFMNLWAVGSMLGSTQTVDMETTRKNEFGRIQVAVLNPMLIQAHLDVVIGDHYFELEFEVERLGLDENGEEMEVAWRGGEGGGDEEEEMEENPTDDRNPKRQKGSENLEKAGDELQNNKDMQTNSLVLNIPELKERLKDLSDSDFEVFLREKAEGILDGVVSETLDLLAEKVLTEENNDLLQENEPHNCGETLTSEVEEEMHVQSSENETQVPETAVFEMEKDREMTIQSGQKQGGGDTVITGLESEVQAAAAIPESLVSPLRASPRLANSSDEHTLKKGARRAAANNLEFLEGDLQGDILGKILVAVV